MRSISILAIAVLLRAMPAAGACAPVSGTAGLCSSVQGNTCFIDAKQCPVVDGTVLDFGTQDVVLRQSTNLNVGTGTMTILAKSLELLPGTALLGPGGTILVQTTGDIRLRPSSAAPCRIDVADPTGADRIELLSTTGTIEIGGVVDARGTNTDGFGGSIDITGANVLVSGVVRTSGGNLGSSGPILIDALTGGVLVSATGVIEGFGGSGSVLELTAETTITTTGRVDIRATAAGGDGGTYFVLTNSGSVSLGGKVFMQGDEGNDTEGGGNGGDLTVLSAGALTLTAEFEVSGAPPDGQGGEILFASILDTVQTGPILAQGRGSESDGGSVTYDSRQGLQLGPVDVHGAENLPDTGGDLTASAWCDLTVPGGVQLNVQGDRGAIELQAGGQMIVAGVLRAGSPIELEYLTVPPITAGSTLSPGSFIEQNPTLTPCGGTPPPSCGDDVDDEGEECDDGDTDSCDGCSSTCKLESCGNGRIDCEGFGPGEEIIFEACDDGNNQSGDACHGDCSRADNVCGDGFVDSDEGCDGGNVTACDGCSSTCQVESCGNGMVECIEECDPPGVGGCSADCLRFVPPGCGNGTVAGDEECDDGNTNDGDGCTHQCREERCGNGTIDPGEDCDDFNTICGDECSPTCKDEVCGNDVVDCEEECDEGVANGTPGSGCLADACVPAPRCSEDGTSPCIACGTAEHCAEPDACREAICQDGVCLPGATKSCVDDDLCNGTETCDPLTGCVAGTAPDCSDGDECTTDACNPATGCTSSDFQGFELPKCRLAAARAVVASAADVVPAMRTKVLKKLGGVEARLLAASQPGASTKKVRKGLKAANRQLAGVTRLVTKQRGKKIAAPAADAILSALSPLPALITQLMP